MTLSYTLHLRLAVPDFLSEPWHAEFAAAMDSIDRALYEGIIVQGTSLWLNSTAYVIGDMVISPDNGSIYVCATPHTSSPAPQTLTQELIDHPTYWGALAASQLATQAEAEAGVENSHYMSPLRTRQAIIAQIGSSGTLLAFTCSVSPPPTPHKGDFWYDLSTGVLSAYIDDLNTLQWVAINAGGGGGFGLGVEPQGRLTLQSGVPVMVTNQTAKTTLFYTPHTGNQIPLWNGLGFTSTAFTELSVLTTDTTKNPAAIGASKVNDWFVWNDAGTVRLSHGVDWTNDTTRAVALTKVSGVWVNGAAIANGPGTGFGTYVGTTRSNASSQLDWTFGASGAPPVAAFFGVWNVYNRVDVATVIGETTTTWTYGATTPRQPNGRTTYQVNFVTGLQEDGLMAINDQMSTRGAADAPFIGIGYDSTASYVAMIFGGAPSAQGTSVSYVTTPASGFHFICPLEAGGPTPPTFYGYGGSSTSYQTGFKFRFRM